MNATIERIMQLPREMTTSQAAYALDRSADFVERAISKDRIEARADEGRGESERRRHMISREALVVYVVRTTRGDRLTLMKAIEQLMPKALYDLAQSIAAPHQPQPDNVIPISGSTRIRAAKRAPAAPVPFDHPDLFNQSA